jgi:DNA polymerase-3 subunit delta
VAELKPVYLISGDDDAKIDAWRGRVRARAERELGPGGLEQFDGKADGAGAVAAALATMTFAEGTRYLLAEPVEGWKADDVAELAPSLAAMPPDTVLVLIARGKPPAKLAKAVQEAGGEVREYSAPKPWELPKWVIDRAREEGLAMDVETAKQLVQSVGSRQQQLQREVEKLSIALHPGGYVTAADVEALASGEATTQVYDLADSIVAADLPAALALAEQLRAADERPGRLVYALVRRLRDVHRAAVLLDAGVPEQNVGAALSMPPWAVKRTVAQARKADREVLERALEAFAEFELESRGGGDRDLDEDTAFTMTLVNAAGSR